MPPRTSLRSAAVVTGHSRGLGAAIAAELLSRDVAVLGVSRGDNPDLRRAYPAMLLETRLDLSDAAAVQRWLAAPPWTEFWQGVERPLLVNNAGLLEPIGPMESQEPEAVARTVSVNVGAVLVLSVAFTHVTTGAADRRILHVSSGAGRKAYAGWSVYCASKAALDHHARSVALDRTPGLRISAIAPGIIDTEMQALIRASSDEDFPDRPRFVAMHREGKLRSATEVARAVVEFYLSDEFGREPVHEMAY